MASNKKIMTLMIITLVGLAFAGCSDSDTSPAAVAIDTAPPAVPTNLDVDYSSGVATISWAANTVDADLAGYIVDREKNSVRESLVSTPALITAYVDNDPLIGASQYIIYAVDTSGNRSAVATINLEVSLGHQTGELSLQ